LLFSGQFKDAVQALLEWLRKVEKVLSEEGPVHGDLDTVMALVEQHKVSFDSGVPLKVVACLHVPNIYYYVYSHVMRKFVLQVKHYHVLHPYRAVTFYI
jgi:hypothetical protein